MDRLGGLREIDLFLDRDFLSRERYLLDDGDTERLDLFLGEMDLFDRLAGEGDLFDRLMVGLGDLLEEECLLDLRGERDLCLVDFLSLVRGTSGLELSEEEEVRLLLMFRTGDLVRLRSRDRDLNFLGEPLLDLVARLLLWDLDLLLLFVFSSNFSSFGGLGFSEFWDSALVGGSWGASLPGLAFEAASSFSPSFKLSTVLSVSNFAAVSVSPVPSSCGLMIGLLSGFSIRGDGTFSSDEFSVFLLASFPSSAEGLDGSLDLDLEETALGLDSDSLDLEVLLLDRDLSFLGEALLLDPDFLLRLERAKRLLERDLRLLDNPLLERDLLLVAEALLERDLRLFLERAKLLLERDLRLLLGRECGLLERERLTFLLIFDFERERLLLEYDLSLLLERLPLLLERERLGLLLERERLILLLDRERVFLLLEVDLRLLSFDLERLSRLRDERLDAERERLLVREEERLLDRDDDLLLDLLLPLISGSTTRAIKLSASFNLFMASSVSFSDTTSFSF